MTCFNAPWRVAGAMQATHASHFPSGSVGAACRVTEGITMSMPEVINDYPTALELCQLNVLQKDT